MRREKTCVKRKPCTGCAVPEQIFCAFVRKHFERKTKRARALNGKSWSIRVPPEMNVRRTHSFGALVEVANQYFDMKMKAPARNVRLHISNQNLEICKIVLLERRL